MIVQVKPVVIKMKSSRQFRFLTGPKKLAIVRMYGSTITG